MGDAEANELTPYCTAQMKRTIENLDTQKFEKALADKSIPTNVRTVIFNGEIPWDGRYKDKERGSCVTMVKNGPYEVLVKTENGKVTTLEFGNGCGVMRTINPKEMFRIVPKDDNGDEQDVVVMAFVEF
tara:strand:+ start:14420 stop:14806 length:387 start_codon:yes stop_codon:yes gene_type:complete